MDGGWGAAVQRARGRGGGGAGTVAWTGYWDGAGGEGNMMYTSQGSLERTPEKGPHERT